MSKIYSSWCFLPNILQRTVSTGEAFITAISWLACECITIEKRTLRTLGLSPESYFKGQALPTALPVTTAVLHRLHIHIDS
jgi:hypothetical protein